MLQKLRTRAQDEKGFTLIELLVVILIIGILAAIALPMFLGQQKKGQDSEAKSNARNMVSQVESCFADKQTYVSCDETGELGTTGLEWGGGAGQVQVISSGAGAATATSYTVVATSKAVEGSNNHTFTIAKDGTTGVISRTCTPEGKGGCQTDGTAGDPGKW